MIASEKQTHDLVFRVKKLLNTNRARAIDAVCQELDELLRASRWDEASVVIGSLAQSKLPLAVLLGALTITFIWREQLIDSRKELSEAARKEAYSLGGDAKVKQIAKFLL